MMEYSASFLDYGPLAQQSSRATSEVLDRDRRHGHVRTLRPERSQPHSMSSPRLISSYGSDNGAGYASRRESTDFNHIASRNETSSLPGQQQVTFERELSTLIPRQISYTSALVGTSFGASGFPENSSYVPRAYLSGIQGSFDGASDLDNTGRTEGRSEFVPQRQVDVYSDGLYLNAASKDSFIGVSLSPPPPTREVISTVQFEKAPSQSETTSTPRSPSRHAKLSCFKTPMTVRSLSTPLSSEQPRALSFESSTQAHGDYPRGLKALSKTLTDVAYDVRSPTKQRIAEPRTKELRRTSVTSYSSLKKGSGRKPAHDFEVVIVERESSGESSEDGDRNDLEFASGYPKEHSAAVKAVDIFREWKVESIAQEQQRLDWETYGKLEQASGSIRFKTAWTKDLLLRNCQRQIQAKLRDGHIFVLQKLPPSVFKAKITTCAQPCCPATRKRILSASYRLSLEPRENLKRAVVSIDELYPSGTVERPDGNVEGGLHGQGKHSITWYCLTCIEDLWNGVGMLQAAPHVKKDALAWSERPERILATTDTVKPYNPSAGTLSYDVDSSHRQAPRSPEALKKKAKIFLRPPCEPTSTIVAKSPPTLMDDDNIRMGVKRAPQKVEPSPQRFLSTRTKRPTAKARDAQDAAKRSPSSALNQHNHLKKPASIRTSDATVPRNDLTATDQPAAPTIGLDLGLSLSIDGAVDDDMPPPRPWRQKGPPRTSILRAAAQVGAMVTDEEEREAALLAIPDRHQADSSVITPRGVPPGNQYPAEGPMTPSSKYNTRGAATRTPGTNNSRRVTTPRPAIKAARPTTPTHSRLITDGGYVTEASANEPEHTADGPLVRSSQTIQERLRRQREVEKILREVESKKTYAAKAKKRKFMDDTLSSSLEPASHFRIQSPAHKCARLQARDANGKFLPKTEDLDADVPTLPSSRVMSLTRRLKRDLDKDSSQNKKFHIPEYWCICHQPDDELGMIQCDGEFCLVGWFHLKCTGLAMVPDEGDSWYCEACSALYYKPSPSFLDTRPHGTYFDGPADTPPVPSPVKSSPAPSLKRRRTQTPTLPNTPPPPQPPPTLAAIASSIHPETRPHPSGYYALSPPQAFALQKWKAVIAYSQIFSNPSNNAFMEKNGLHYAYPEDCPEIYVGGETRTMRGVMEIGGLLVEVSAEEVRGRELSEILRGVDERVGRELEKVGWVDVVPRPGERGKVRLKLRVGKKEKVVEEREGKGENREDTSFESDEEEDLAEKGALG